MHTITEVSRTLDVSTRMLRYYEQQGLITSRRREDYAYRVYDEENVNRLRIILVLRQLRVPLKAIRQILTECDADQAIAILQQRAREVQEEIRSLETIRQVLLTFIHRIGGASGAAERVASLGDEGLIAAVRALGLSSETLKERVIMSEINHAEQEQWRKLNVRILLLPPMTVAAFHYVGADPEDHVGEMTSRFVQESRLYEVKPDSRMFGFNHPNPTQEQPVYGYEYWVTIPQDMDVPAPGEKKTMPGGLYAAHSMTFPNFHEWQWLSDWVDHSPEWQSAALADRPDVMFGLLEEHLNWVWALHSGSMDSGAARTLDLLLPVGKREE